MENTKQALSKIKKITNNKNLTFKKINTESDISFNCWGFVAFALNWLDELIWLEENEMDYCLENLTVPVTEPQIGDIVVYTNEYNQLEHTAILIDPVKKEVIHKPGILKLETNTVDEVKKIYINTDVCYKRPLKNKKFDSDDFMSYQYDFEEKIYDTLLSLK